MQHLSAYTVPTNTWTPSASTPITSTPILSPRPTRKRKLLDANDLSDEVVSVQNLSKKLRADHPNRKRKRDEPFGQSRSTKRRLDINETTVCSGYKCYGDSLPLKVIEQIERRDTGFKLSSLLGFTLTANVLLQSRTDMYEYEPVELVTVAALKKFVNSTSFKKSTRKLDQVSRYIEQGGIREPLCLLFDPKQHKCIIDDGHATLAYAIKEGIRYLPAVVQKCPFADDVGKKVSSLPKNYMENNMFPPSAFGLTTFQSRKTYTDHPYLPKTLVEKIKVHYTQNTLQELKDKIDVLAPLKPVRLSALFVDAMEIDQIGE